MKKMFSAWVKDKRTKELVRIDSECINKISFISDLRSNGYMVNPDMVKESEVFEWIMKNTNADKVEWKYINRIPSENESVSDIIWKGINKTTEKMNKNFYNKYGYNI